MELTAPILQRQLQDSVKKQLQRLCGGTSGVCSNDKFKRVQPLYLRLRG